VEETRDLPDSLAQHGRVSISRKQTARLIGQVRCTACALAWAAAVCFMRK
jgi:uncharacterized Rmd1/YagE family protein